MFVGCVVAGCVVIANKGVRVRGALLRDAAAYAAAAALVAVLIHSGRMNPSKAGLLLVFYVVFIAIVFTADIAHILAQRMRWAILLAAPQRVVDAVACACAACWLRSWPGCG